ncbi:AAA family ATPase [Amycolatopsis sp. lyj-109]|uniref:AAA family ATPase n=1 Tax=Amycolatopsis sp. lyj-109 TaxID=2789287 RepID=UPI003978069B
MKLILLNGPPGSGKSTLARRYADHHPPALALDVDRIRAMLGGWRASPGEAGLLARDIAVAAARTHLGAGHDVVVPQLVVRAGFPERLEALASECGASFHEVALVPGAGRRPETPPPSLGGVPKSSLSAPTDEPGFRGRKRAACPQPADAVDNTGSLVGKSLPASPAPATRVAGFTKRG